MTKITDFNDLHSESGLDAIRDIFQKALSHAPNMEGGTHLSQTAISPVSQTKSVGPFLGAEPPAPPVMDIRGLYGLLGRIADIGCANSEADPIAVCSYFLARFGAMLGRRVHQQIGDGELHARPFFLVVGKSGKARKGTSEAFPRRLLDHTEDTIILGWPKLKIHSGGLSSGEGVGYALRDPSEKQDAEGNPVNPGVNDKRLLVVESEFANVLSSCKREGNILSATIRNLWDGRDIEPLTKNNRWKASNPHCTILAHITGFELIDRLSSNDMANGFLNRFIVIFVSRKKLVPNPMPTDKSMVESLSNELAKVLDFVDACSSETEPLEIRFDSKALELWSRVYPDVSQERPGVEGMLLARSETYARMLAMMFALLDRSDVIRNEHLFAALCWINFWVDSIRFIFRNQKEIVEQEQSAELADKIYALVSANANGMSRAEISGAFNRHLTKKQLDDAIEILLNSAPPRLIARQSKTNGATKTIYLVCSAK